MGEDGVAEVGVERQVACGRTVDGNRREDAGASGTNEKVGGGEQEEEGQGVVSHVSSFFGRWRW